ncbi:MAG TPA: hypothetical protein VM866_09570 [Pyrinomonadaceae bacterium]|nr:hypothetical protein [Pyrinomonadaceae bacterium]
MEITDDKIETLVRELPDPEGARFFCKRLTTEHARAARQLARDAGLLSDTLALAAWSPLLATTLGQNPDYFAWLARERTLLRVRSAEELGESLARFASTNTQLSPQVLLARFRRRELLRTYLHDIRRTRTLVETTEELSNLADSVVHYALGLAQQELENLYGVPQHTNARGRLAVSGFAIVALGKLGSRELNYASDIDLLFLYSDDGVTSGIGERGPVTNREYFSKLAERVARIAGQPVGEGAAYRVDLRLRPHGRDGALSCSLAEALRYYHEAAQAWELQALIRARLSAGSSILFTSFMDGLRARVYRTDETIESALRHVRLAKQKIDRHHRVETGGYNVKLGRGGIREIEFIAQALQLAHGGRDAWLHAPHTLISLGRLADRALITERERTTLPDAYSFLRTLEHRVQMEHGLQTHSVPEDRERRALVARRMNFSGQQALHDFDNALDEHTANVRAAYARVFGTAEKIVGREKNLPLNEATKEQSEQVTPLTNTREKSTAVAEDGDLSPSAEIPASSQSDKFSHSSELRRAEQNALITGEESAAVAAASVFAAHLAGRAVEKAEVEQLARALTGAARATINPRRALTFVGRVAASLDKSDASVALSEASLGALVHLCGVSELFGEMLASNPALISSLLTPATVVAERDHRALLRAAVDAEKSLGGELAALRRTWTRLLIEIGACDAAGAISMNESNILQSTLAAASLNAAYLIARREMARRYGKLDAGPRVSILGLGRLGSNGTDYGSDLDIVLIYDPIVASPVAALTREEVYARLAELLVTALSSSTRDGYLYRVDMRLRPDGKNGPVAMGVEAFVNYLRERADVWEWLAYVKLRAVAGDLELGRDVERAARGAIHSAARKIDAELLRAETRRVRERLERERAAKTSAGAVDIKFGAGGMLDVYFAARYLQLRDNVPDDEGDRSTRATLNRLRAANSLDDEDHASLCDGYTLLRTLDHHLRLLVGRSTLLPVAEDHPVVRDLARRAGYGTVADLRSDLASRMSRIRAAYDRITEG